MSIPVLAANLKWLFSEWPLAERFGAAAACGFRAVELSLPYALAVTQLRQLLDRHQLRFVYLLAAPGDWDGGERGLACIPGREAEFRDGVDLAISYAIALGKPFIHTAAGNRPGDAGHEECEETLRQNLKWACARAAVHDLRLVLEPVCRRDYPRYSVNTTADVHRVIEAVAAPNLGVVLDLHHVQWEGGESADRVHAALRASIRRLWHVQLALAPDRNGPGESTYDIHATLSEALRLGYTGVFSCEYRPAGATLPSLAWAQRYGIRAADISSTGALNGSS